MATRRKHRLTLDVGPLFEEQWTGIPVFTRRLVESLQKDRRFRLDFSFNLAKVPEALVLEALRCMTGLYMRDQFERYASENFELIDRHVPILFPSVKEVFNVAQQQASTVHDLSTLVMPENHEQSNVDHHLGRLMKELATNDVIFCASEATRAALNQTYPSAAAKSKVLYQYADWPQEFDAMERNLPPPGIGRYAAVIGTIEPRKNLKLILDALSQPEVRKSDIRFVVIGRKGWKIDQFLSDLTPQDRERLLFSGFVSEFVKYRLLRHAEFLVFPSVYEGFGIPALEAMSLGKPVLASFTSSFPEVIGEAGVYYDPLSPTAFAAAFAEITNLRRLEELKKAALKGAAAFGSARMVQPVAEWLDGK